jgi:hypothetical protein
MALIRKTIWNEEVVKYKVRKTKTLPVPEVTYVIEVLCFDCARFYTAEVPGWNKEIWLELRDEPEALVALRKGLQAPLCPCCGKTGSITSLGHLEACRHLSTRSEPIRSPGHFTNLDPQP